MFSELRFSHLVKNLIVGSTIVIGLKNSKQMNKNASVVLVDVCNMLIFFLYANTCFVWLPDFCLHGVFIQTLFGI